MSEPLLKVEHLSVDYEVGAGTFHALQDVAFELSPGRVVGIVGETGCGKSTLAHTIPRLLPEPPARILSGSVVFQGIDILQLPLWKLPMVRGTGIGMIFQEPINSLNPAYRIFDQVAEAIKLRRVREAGGRVESIPGTQPFDYSRRDLPKTSEVLTQPIRPGALTSRKGFRIFSGRNGLKDEVLEYLKLVRINDPGTILDLFPHELSGGMRQRIMIAIALSGRPSLLIADEPTSALDLTIQAQVLTLMRDLMNEINTAILFISHDLGVIAEMADDVGVMYAGHLVEFGPVTEVYERPRHPYTKALLRSVPNRYKTDGPLPSLPGSVPNLSRLPPGCPFHPRCPLARPICTEDPGPAFLEVGEPSEHIPHRAACHFSEEVATLP